MLSLSAPSFSLEQTPPQQVRDAVVALKEERPRRSNPFIAELLDELYEIKVHPTTVRNILIEAGKYTCSRERRRPAIRFEAKSFGEIYPPLARYIRWILPPVPG